MPTFLMETWLGLINDVAPVIISHFSLPVELSWLESKGHGVPTEKGWVLTVEWYRSVGANNARGNLREGSKGGRER